MATDLELAWAAGLFEGEGCLTISNQTINGIKGKYQQPRLKLSMVDRDIVLRFFDIIKVGNLCEQKFRNPLHKSQLCWYTGNRKYVVEVINLLVPYFGARRTARAQDLLKLCNKVTDST